MLERGKKYLEDVCYSGPTDRKVLDVFNIGFPIIC